jgi:cyanophycinase
MNAQGKVIAAIGGGAPVLCQHMVAFDHGGASALPLVHRERIQFAPGLGMVNRVVVEAGESATDFGGQMSLGRLLTAVGYNPFLTGMSLEPGSGAALYANGQIEVFGTGTALVVDGSALTHTSLHDAEGAAPASLLGVQLHLLALGCTYSIESHLATAPNPDEVQLQSNAVKAAF